MSQYRIREAVVSVHVWRDHFRRERRFLAERRVAVLGPLAFWWPVSNGDWRRKESEAVIDMENDIGLRQPLAMRYFEVEP